MSLSTQWSSENDEIFRDTRMDDVHCTHCTPRIVKYPFRVVCVYTHYGRGIALRQVRDDVGYYSCRIVGRGGNGSVGELVKEDGVKGIPPVLPCNQII